MSYLTENAWVIHPLLIPDDAEECFAALMSDGAIVPLVIDEAEVRRRAEIEFPCICTVEYTGRNLRDRWCLNHKIGQMASEWVQSALNDRLDMT